MLSESTFVSDSPSGSSIGASSLELQALASEPSVSWLALAEVACDRTDAGAPAGEPAGDVAGPSEIVTSGITSATAGFAARRVRSARETVAANESINVNGLIARAPEARS